MEATGTSSLTTSFRRAGSSDILPISRLLREFYRKAGGCYLIPFNLNSTLSTVEDVIRHGICLAGDGSCAGAIIQDFPFNSSAHVAYVVFWAFKPAREIGIFKALMDACKLAGATHLTAASHFPRHTIQRHYGRLGLTPADCYSITAL